MRTVIQELIREYMYRLAQANSENSRAFSGPRSPVIARGLGAHADWKKKGESGPVGPHRNGPPPAEVRSGGTGWTWRARSAPPGSLLGPRSGHWPAGMRASPSPRGGGVGGLPGRLWPQPQGESRKKREQGEEEREKRAGARDKRS